MRITNGHVLLVFIFCVVSVIRRFIRRRNSFLVRQLHEMRWRANENRNKAKSVYEDFCSALEYFQNLSLQYLEKDELKFIQNLIKLCRLRISYVEAVEGEWKFIEDYLEISMMQAGENGYVRLPVNIRKLFGKNYKRSMRVARCAKLVRSSENLLRRRYRYLYLLPLKNPTESQSVYKSN